MVLVEAEVDRGVVVAVVVVIVAAAGAGRGGAGAGAMVATVEAGPVAAYWK